MSWEIGRGPDQAPQELDERQFAEYLEKKEFAPGQMVRHPTQTMGQWISIEKVAATIRSNEVPSAANPVPLDPLTRIANELQTLRWYAAAVFYVWVVSIGIGLVAALLYMLVILGRAFMTM